MQEVYRKFYIRLTRNMLPILNPRRYLFSIAKKELSRYYLHAGQRKMEQPIEELNDIVSDDAPLDERLLVEERKDTVWHVLQNEPALNRRIFYLFYGCDRSQKDIAKAFDLPGTPISSLYVGRSVETSNSQLPFSTPSVRSANDLSSA